jgi:heptosyltransferase-2
MVMGSAEMIEDIRVRGYSDRASRLTPHRPVRRLLVRGPNWIGDAVMSEPALAELRRLFPKTEISLLVKPHIAALFGGHPAVDRLVVYEDRTRHAGIIGKWVLASSLRRVGFDLAILFQNAFEAALLAFLGGIPRRYGYATDGRSVLLTDPIPRPDSQRLLCHKLHQVDYYFELLRSLGSGKRLGSPKLYLSPAEDEQAQQLLHRHGVNPSDLVIGLNPGSTYGGAKRWLPERFAETADRLLERVRTRSRHAHIVIVGGKGEEQLGHEIAERMRVQPIVLSGQTTIRELMGIIKRCALFLTNDTGPMHIAAAFEVPIVGIFGPTDDQETGPVGDLKTLVRRQVECSPCFLRECPIDHRCMTRITVEDVFDAAVRQLPVGTFQGSTYQDPNMTTLRLSDVETPLRGVTVFFDRDGTLNVERGYVTAAEQLELHPGAAEAIARLNQSGARVVLITNQSAIGRGLVTDSRLEEIHAQLQVLLNTAGGKLDGIYVCPHHPDDHCECRKPATGLVKRAVADLGLDLTASYMVGDQKRDVDLARAAGSRSVLVLTGPTSLEALNAIRAEGYAPDHVAHTLLEAVNWILDDVKARSTNNV